MRQRNSSHPRGLRQRERRDKTITLRVSESTHGELDQIRRRAARQGMEWSIQEALHNALQEEIEAMRRWLNSRESEHATQVRSGALATLPPSELQD